MSRPMLPAVAAETEKGLIRPAILVELQFDSAPVRVWSGVGPLVWNDTDPYNAVDATGNGFGGTVSGLGSTAGLIGPRAHLWPGGTTSPKIALPGGVMDGLGDFTFEAMAKPTKKRSTDLQAILSAANVTIFNEVHLFFLNGSLRANIKNGPDAGYTPGFDIYDGVPRRYSFTRNGTTGAFEYFVDGFSLGAPIIKPGGNLAVDAGGLFLGQEQDSLGGGFSATQSFEGVMDDVRIWNKIRTPAEMQADRNQALTGSEAGLVAYYRFDETIKTFSGTGQLGRIAGATETIELRAVGRTMELNGLDPAIAALALGEDYQGRPAMTWLALLDASGLVIPDPVLLFDDTMDTMTIKDNGDTATIILAVEAEITQLLQASERRYTDADQKTDHPDDEGFQYIADLEEKEILWGIGRSFKRFGAIPSGPRD